MTTVTRNFGTFPGLLNELFGDSGYANLPQTQPAANITENENGFTVSLAAPGFQKENFKIEVQQKSLKITVEKAQEETPTMAKFIRKEFSFDTFERSFRLPNTVDTDAIDATYANGILELSIPKKEETKPKEPTLLAVK